MVTPARTRLASPSSDSTIVTHDVVSISVDLGITTPDQLRHIAFGLEKDTADDGTVLWTIHFAMQARESTSDNFVDQVNLDVTVKVKNFNKAEATAHEGFSDPQVGHLNGPVTAVSQLHAQGNATDNQLSRVVEGTIPLH
jgi:hypothetical protein